MRELPRYMIAVTTGIVIFTVLRYFFPPSPAPETAQLECSFIASEQAATAAARNSSGSLERLYFKAELTGKFVNDGTVLWYADGVASYQGGSQHIAGAVFLLPSNKVRGLGLYRDSYPHKADDLRISTLNENGNLDWNESSAFIYLEDAADKRAHAFDYRCNVAQGKSD